MSVDAAYDVIADDYADTFAGTEAEQPADLGMIEQFGAALDPAGERRVLDAGCGAGRMLPVLRSLGCDVSGIDLSRGMLARARTDWPDFTVSRADLTALPLADGCLDGYFSWYSLIHLDDAAATAAIREAARVLRKETGVALFGFQVGSGARDIGATLARRGHAVSLLRWHRAVEQMERWLDSAGFVSIARMSRLPVPGEPSAQGVAIARLG